MKNRDFRISGKARKDIVYFNPVFETDNGLTELYRQAQEVAHVYNKKHQETLSAAKLNCTAVLHLAYETVISFYIKHSETDPFSRITVMAEKNDACKEVLNYYATMFPTLLTGEVSTEEVVREFFVHQIYQENPALLRATLELLSQDGMNFPQGTKALKTMLGSYLSGTTINQSSEDDLFSFLTYPARLFPDSLSKQISYILKHWAEFLPKELQDLLLRSIDYENEEKNPHTAGVGQIQVPNYSGESEYESFSEDRNWMPNVVMMAKSTLVWLDQLSKKYQRQIDTLDKIPDEELDYLRDCGFTALWLIGLWQRSPASKKIKQLCGNPDAESSAYSLKGYIISDRLGGWNALSNLKERCAKRGIRLASDMVPNHTGLDSDWLKEHHDYFIQQSYPPFPSYTYNGPDLSDNQNIEIKIEDHYYNRTDAAVTFRRRDKRTGETTYIYHGNDGTTMPWNDTAQIDFLNPLAREAVIKQIIEVAKNFPIIRFDAAMTLAKRHIQRLWYPKSGTGGDIAGRTSFGMSDEEFNSRIPNEFWREVVDRMTTELPDTLLLAEAFWMMESYFVRTLGMHRVYNSAFMHMMKNQDNQKYRDSIKSTLVFDPEILKRYVNFMNNPDEETAIAQFGDSDKYFGVCTLLATMPGLPMFGHGQIEGFREKYGMEYQRAYWDEKPDRRLIEEHNKKIFPLLRMRNLFSECVNFQLFDAVANGEVQQSIYAYTNGNDTGMTLVLYNNRIEHAEGKIYQSVPKLVRKGETKQTVTVSLAESLRLTRSPRRFVIYKNFTDGLIYLAPSMKIYDEGYWISLDGYQSRVLIDIHEIEDIDGIYAKIYDKLKGCGVPDLELEKRITYLEPFFEAAKVIKSQRFLKELKAILCGKSSDSTIKEIMQSLGTCYTYIEELCPLFEKLDIEVRQMKPAKMLESLNAITQLCKNNIFSKGNTVMEDDIAFTLSAAFLLMAFIPKDCSLEQAIAVSDKLLLEKFYSVPKEITDRAAILVVKNLGTIDNLLHNNSFLNLIGCNEYNCIRWYKGESFQECMYLVFFRKAFIQFCKEGNSDTAEYEKEIRYWLQKDAFSGYKVDKLIQQ